MAISIYFRKNNKILFLIHMLWRLYVQKDLRINPRIIDKILFWHDPIRQKRISKKCVGFPLMFLTCGCKKGLGRLIVFHRIQHLTSNCSLPYILWMERELQNLLEFSLKPLSEIKIYFDGLGQVKRRLNMTRNLKLKSIV